MLSQFYHVYGGLGILLRITAAVRLMIGIEGLDVKFWVLNISGLVISS